MQYKRAKRDSTQNLMQSTGRISSQQYSQCQQLPSLNAFAKQQQQQQSLAQKRAYQQVAGDASASNIFKEACYEQLANNQQLRAKAKAQQSGLNYSHPAKSAVTDFSAKIRESPYRSSNKRMQGYLKYTNHVFDKKENKVSPGVAGKRQKQDPAFEKPMIEDDKSLLTQSTQMCSQLTQAQLQDPGLMKDPSQLSHFDYSGEKSHKKDNFFDNLVTPQTVSKYDEVNTGSVLGKRNSQTTVDDLEQDAVHKAKRNQFLQNLTLKNKKTGQTKSYKTFVEDSLSGFMSNPKFYDFSDKKLEVEYDYETDEESRAASIEFINQELFQAIEFCVKNNPIKLVENLALQFQY